MTELKPCPFCGGKAEFHISSYDGNNSTRKWWFDVRCKKCFSRLPNVYRIDVLFSTSGDIKILTDERNKAVEKWNRRVNNEKNIN